MQKRRNFLITAAAAISIASAAGGIGQAAAQEDTINWSVHVDLTGPASYGGIPQAEGFKSYVEWKNADGGIRGRQIKLEIHDTTFKTDVAVATYKKALASGRVDYVFGDSTAMIQAISPENNTTQKVLTGGGSFASELADKENYPFYFVAGATYGNQLELLVDYVAQSAGKDAKLAIMHSSISLGRDGIEQAKARAEMHGIEVVLVQQTKFVETDVSAFALAIRQAQPTHVLVHGYSFAVWPEVIRLVRDYGMDDTVFMGSMWQNEHEKVLELSDIADGLVGINVFNVNSRETEGEMMKVINDIHEARDPNFNGYVRLGFLDGWINAMMATKAFEMVIDEGKEITGVNLAAAMASIKDWDTGGIVGAPVTMSGQQIGLGQVIRWEKVDGDWAPVPVSDWMKVN
ncbi:ABC transporter substrate-binding protein [Hoeflea sp. EC-HK425]|uniref:ABC transporter substrate-binding protein n=1 Tax=Hoeflea sp. EC-HK425 TaxID=2038388 RepID=UPI001257D96A|nr:ABC transporter substrate-binding protein [Hoeflea sp. EC-HK425]VVT01189.1 Amino acid/amide ABC transporter substrate-binding protein, HAAT family [Hoeflea sp. EC-HK425]